MKRMTTRLISIVLALILCAQAVPLTAIAALVDNDPEYNREILESLAEVVGSEEEAEQYYALLEHYGLLDEDGNLSESWEIWMDGEQVTLDYIRALLSDPNCDLDIPVLVDGQPITLGNIKTILEIEEYLAYLQATYFDGHQWTAEQQASLMSLVEQIETEGIIMRSASDVTVVGGSGISHDARVALTVSDPENNTVTVTAALTNAAAGQTVTFDWEALSGSQPVSGSGTVEMTADAAGTASSNFTVTLGDTTDIRSSVALTCYIKLCNLTNALFENEKQNTVVTVSTLGTVTAEQMASVAAAAAGTSRTFTTPALSQEFSLTSDEIMARDWGLLTHAEMTEFAHNTNAVNPSAGANFRTVYADYVLYQLVAGTSTNNLGPILRFEKKQETTEADLPNVPHTGEGASATPQYSGYNINTTFPDNYTTYSELATLNVDKMSFTAMVHYTKYEASSYTYENDRTGLRESVYFWDQAKTGEKVFSALSPDRSMSCTIVFSDKVMPTVTSITAPAGTYYPGQVVPVTVTFSEPVNAATAKVKFNGDNTEYSAAEGSGYSNVLTFPYTVQAVDNPGLAISYISATDTGNNDMNPVYPGGDVGTGLELDGVKLETPVKADAITNVSAKVKGSAPDEALEVTVDISNVEKMTEWMDSEQDTDGKLYAKGLSASLDGGKTMHKLYFVGDSFSDGLTASIPLGMNTSGNDVTHVSELYMDTDTGVELSALLFGKARSAVQKPVVFIEKDDLSAFITFSDYKFEDESNPVFYVQGSDLGLLASINLTDTGFTFSDTSKVAVDGTEEAKTADFVWKSSDTTVAEIAANGTITPTGKTGSTQITLTARNGGVEGKAVTVTATYTVNGVQKDTLKFGAGLTPFLTIPNDTISITDGMDAVVYWTSNLCDKNGEEATTFTVTVKQGETVVYSTTVSGTAANPAASVKIPGDVLSYEYGAGGSHEYEVTVSSVFEDVTYEDTATISLAAQPARVSLDPLDSYYILDTAGSVNIDWSVENLDKAEDVDQDKIFKFQITRNDKDIVTYVPLDLDSDGCDSGTFTLDIEDVAENDDPTGYRDVYTVTIQAKNGTDSTWSYDSFLLYVYDEDALKIMVGDGTDDKENVSAATMSNVADIASMSQSQILALKRDIYLKKIISANYGEYAWTEVADQISWASEDSSIASINYQQGTLYENIENFDYVSYRPTTEFGLAGLQDGSTTITAQHKLTGMTAGLEVTVETLKDKLYLFQCYPQAETTLRYQDSSGTWKEVTSDPNGAAAIYEENGIHSDIYCSATVDGLTYLGTFYLSDVKTGEGDWTKLERYPCNNLTMRQAAYAYIYLKNPDGTPYTGSVNFRGGVYVNGEYVQEAYFGLNNNSITGKGYEDNNASLNGSGKLTVIMDQTQWPGGMVSAQDDVQYVFEISPDGTTYYPLLLTVDATVNIDAYVGNGEAVVTFRSNTEEGKHPFIAAQSTAYTGYGRSSNILDTTGNIGPNGNFDEAVLSTSVMWWGADVTDVEPSLRLITEKGFALATENGQHTITHGTYPFTSFVVTEYKANLNQSTMDAIFLDVGYSTGLTLEYYQDGKQISRKETLPFRLCNLIGVEKVEEARSITDLLSTMGQATDTNNNRNANPNDFGNDIFINAALELVTGDSYSTGDDKLFRIQIVPTSDPTKFLGFIEANVGNIRDKDQVTGIYAPGSETGDQDIDYLPGLAELMTLTGKRSIYSYLMDDYNRVLKHEKVRNLKFQIGGYAESLIYYNHNTHSWEIQVLNGGFNLGGGVTYTRSWTWMAGPVPFTTSLTIGGSVEISMDALSVAYYNINKQANYIGNDFLTQLRIYLYLHFFAGVGIDYAIIAFKLGIYGQISVDMQFAWLNRPYMDVDDVVYNMADGSDNEPIKEYYELPALDENGNRVYDENGNLVYKTYEFEFKKDTNLNGQKFKIDGQIGLQFVARLLFFAYEKILFSYSFNLLDKETNNWTKIQDNWEKNKEAQMAAISSLLARNSISVSNVGGQQMMTLNLAPTLESRDYLEEGSFWNDGSFGFFALDDDSSLKDLQYNSYPYANPVVTDDGAIVAFLSDGESPNVEDTRASFAVRNESGMYNEGDPIDADTGYGDSQIALSGSADFAAAAWTRQMESIDKDAGAVITAEDQMIMMDSTEIHAAVYDGSSWTTTRLTENGSADLAPVVAANSSCAIVAWRAVESSGEEIEVDDGSIANVTNFDEKDTILYRIYSNGYWSDTHTLYNGTSGAVKAITAAMMDDGTAAVAYTLDTDGDENTTTDREIYYAVVDNESCEVTRNVRATNDAYLDENPQLTAVKFPSAGDDERFVLGWYTEQAVSSDSAVALDGGEAEATGETTADIRLLDFNENGIYTQLLPDSISQAASDYDVSITPSFRFTKNADSITNLSIIWVERAGGGSAEAPSTQEKDTYSDDVIQNMTAEKDVLKGIKFYTYGQHDELITFTGAVDVAEMGDGTLIDHFDAYVSNAETNEIKAVILGSTYGANGTVTRTGTTIGGDTVEYTVPSRTTSIYTATETYQDKIEVPAVLADYETIRKGAATEILFTVDNNGIHAINTLTFTLAGGHTTTYEDLNLLPGSSIQLYADYVVPDEVVDVEYTVQATFDQDAGASGEAETFALVKEGRRTVTQDLTKVTGMVYLDIPDLEITEASIVSEEDGKRTILVKLNNDSDSELAGSGRTVKIGFYSDATCETEIEQLAPISVTTEADLAMIDEGGYSVSTVFDVKAYLESMSEDAEEAITEIPDSGIRVFVKADVLENDSEDETDDGSSMVILSNSTEDDVLPEVILSNNIDSVVCENLKTRTGTDAIITSTLATDDSGSTVTVTIQNTRLSKTFSGNIIVTLLDSNGNVLGQQQSYSSTDGLITLSGEEKKVITFAFAGEEFANAASAQAVYSDLILESDNADLTSLSFSNIPGITLDSFVEDEEGLYRASVSTKDLTSTAVMAVAASGSASISLSDDAEGSNILSENVKLVPGTTQEITITVTNGSAQKTYVLTVQNSDSTPDAPASRPTTYRVTVEKSENGSVTASPTQAAAGKTVTLTVTPDIGYSLETLTVTTGTGKKIELTDKGNGKYTFKMPSGKVTVKATFKETEAPFVDVAGDAYYYDAVLWAVENGITTGTSATTFSPDAYCTRAQAVTFLWRAAGCPAAKTSVMPFTDVAQGSYYYDAVLWAVSNGITTGTSATTFSPDLECTRAQIVTFLWRSQGSKEASAYNPFMDVADDAYYYDAVLWAVDNNITNGTSATTFSPDAVCTRGQIVTFLWRCLAK